ncbi:MAG TPA: hypothetical protein VNJ04_10300, partial [Gemmatimonadaceae bacterium]|nr:hypothetical protein [Gemmatimonadaceae bacterium]
EGSAAARQTGVQVSPREGVAAAEASETRPGSTAAASKAGAAGMTTKSATPLGASARPPATRQELSRFCAAVRGGAPVACGPLEASHSARACIRGNEAIKQKKRLEV